MKNKAEITKILIDKGGYLWEKNGYERIYFDAGVIANQGGLQTSRYHTGHISSATLDGEAVSNSKAYKILSNLGSQKFWYDPNDNKFYTRTVFGRGLEETPSAIWVQFTHDIQEAINSERKEVINVQTNDSGRIL